jgi:hypothetical protein
MATDATAVSGLSSLGALRARVIAAANNPTGISCGRLVLYKGTKSHDQSALNTNGDTDVLFTFPSNCYLLDVSVSTSAALDSHATPTLESDIAIGTAAGVVSATLVESSTSLQSANGVIRYGVSSTSAAVDVAYDVSDDSLILTTDAAAATAGTVATLTFYALCYVGSLADLGSAG